MLRTPDARKPPPVGAAPATTTSATKSEADSTAETPWAGARPFVDGGGEYFPKGWRAIPMTQPLPAKKNPVPGQTGFKKRDPRAEIHKEDVEGWRQYWSHNLGVVMNADMFAVDVDAYGEGRDLAIERWETLRTQASLPDTWVSGARFDDPEAEGSGIRYYRVKRDIVAKEMPDAFGNEAHPGGEIIYWGHRYAIVWPSWHHSGVQYRWKNPAGEVVDEVPAVADIPVLSEAQFDEVKRWLVKWGADSKPERKPRALRAVKDPVSSPSQESPHREMLSRQLSLANKMVRTGEAVDDELEALRAEYLAVPHTRDDSAVEDDFDRAWEGAVEKAEARAEERLAGRERLLVTNVADLKDQMVEKVGTGPTSGLFLREGRMTHVPTIGQEGYKPVPVEEGEDGPAQVWEVGENLLGHVFEQAYWLYREKEAKGEDGEKYVVEDHIMMPTAIIKRLLGASHMMPNLRHLAGVVHTPLMRPDGTLLTEAGYDAPTRLLYLPDADVEVPADPTGVQVLAAQEVLESVIGDFPWKHEGDKANYLAALVLPFLRLVVPPPWPMWMLNAHQPGSGKTMLSKILRYTHGGVQRSALPKDEDEIRKQLTSVLLATGGQVIVWDNVMGLVKSAELAGLLTAKTRTDRRLGVSEDVTVTNDRLFAMTGNNLSIGGDLPRRVVWVSIDPKMPNPEMRAPSTFRVPDPDLWVRDHLSAFRGALLTLLAAWAADGMKVGKVTRTDDYGRLAAVMEGVLPYVDPSAGKFMDPATSMATVAVDDEDWALFLHALYETYGTKPFTCRQVVALDFRHEVTLARPEDLTVKATAAGLTSRTLGMFFKNRDGRWHGEYCLRLGPLDASKTNLWTVEKRS